MQTNNFVRNVQDIVEVCDNFRFPTLAEQRELVRQGLAIEKSFGDNVLFKYHRNVMYDYAWNKSKHLMECRGHVYSNTTGELLVAPPRKSFNYLENDWWKDVPLDAPVFYAKKYNGFLACVTTVGDKITYTTTGSMDSVFTGYAEEILHKHVNSAEIIQAGKYATFHVEVMHKDDPHIVDDGIDHQTLTYRYHNNSTGAAGIQSPRGMVKSTLGDVMNLAKLDKGEGFMVYHHQDYKFLSPCKIKTPYYVGKKKLMRMHVKQIEKMYTNPAGFASEVLPSMWLKMPSLITNLYGLEEWKTMDAQERRAAIEFEENFLEV